MAAITRFLRRFGSDRQYTLTSCAPRSGATENACAGSYGERLPSATIRLRRVEAEALAFSSS